MSENNEKIEVPEVICNNCNGHFNTVDAPRIGEKVFNHKIFKRVMLQCNNCGKVSNHFFERIKKQ